MVWQAPLPPGIIILPSPYQIADCPKLSTLHPQVVKARSQLTDARAKAATLHHSGASGPQLCFAWADHVDEVVNGLIQAAVQTLPTPLDPSCFAFIALGGYGRRDLAPFSDIDLMLLYRGVTEAQIAPLRGRTQRSLPRLLK